MHETFIAKMPKWRKEQLEITLQEIRSATESLSSVQLLTSMKSQSPLPRPPQEDKYNSWSFYAHLSFVSVLFIYLSSICGPEPFDSTSTAIVNDNEPSLPTCSIIGTGTGAIIGDVVLGLREMPRRIRPVLHNLRFCFERLRLLFQFWPSISVKLSSSDVL